METASERFNAAVGRQLRAEIAAGGSSLAAMAREIGIARSALDNYVNGKRAIPVPIAYEICAVLHIAPSVVVARAEERFAAEAHNDELSARRARRVGTPGQTHEQRVARAKETEPTEEQ